MPFCVGMFLCCCCGGWGGWLFGCYKVVLRNNWKIDALSSSELLRCSSNLIFCFNPNYFTINSFISRSWHRSLCSCCSDYSAHGCLLDWKYLCLYYSVYVSYSKRIRFCHNGQPKTALCYCFHLYNILVNR